MNAQPSGCLDASAINAFISGKMESGDLGAFVGHLSQCLHCREVVRLAVTEEAPRLPPGHRVGPYEVVRVVGEGAMGVVYEAFDARLERKLALKVMRIEGADPERRKRVETEARALARLSHPNIVPVHDIREEDENLFIAMDFVDGETLGAWQRRQVSWRAVLEVYLQVASALQAVHEVGLVHRDFKPANVLMRTPTQPVLIDFGLARVVALGAGDARNTLALALSQSGKIIGTPAYMAPEQYQAQASPASDQFSFCAALFEALYGGLPRQLDAPSGLDAGARAEAPPTATVGVPSAVERTLRRGLSEHPEQRFASMRELSDALGSALEERRRRRRALASAALAVLLLAIGAWVLAASDRELTAQQALARAEQELHSHRFEDARIWLSQVVRRNPSSPEVAFFTVLLAWWEDAGPDKIREYVRRAEAFGGSAARRATVRGLLLIAEEKYAEAQEQLRAAVQENPDDKYLRYALFEALQHGGKAAEAIAVYDGLHGQFPDFRLGMPHALDFYVGRGDVVAQDRYLKRPSVENDRDYDLWRVRRHLSGGDLERAIALARSMIDPKSTSRSSQLMRVELAGLLALRGELDEATAVVAPLPGPVTGLVRVGLALAAGDPTATAAVREGGKAGDQLLSEARLPSAADAVLLFAPLGGRPLLSSLQGMPVNRHRVGAHTFRTLAAWAEGDTAALATLESSPFSEVTTLARALGAKGEDATALFHESVSTGSDTQFLVLRWFLLAQAEHARGNPEGVLAACKNVILPRSFSWSWATAIGPCLAWSARAEPDPRRAADFAAQLRKLRRRAAADDALLAELGGI